MKQNFLYHRCRQSFRYLSRLLYRLLAFFSFKELGYWLLPHAACVLIEHQGRVLAVSRKDHQTQFGLPGGKVEDDESDLAAAVRELQEETGIQLLGWLDLEKVYEGTDDFEYWTVCYRYRPKYVSPIHHAKNFILNPKINETGIVKWVDRQVLLEGPFGNYNKQVFAIVDQLKEQPLFVWK